MAVTVEVRQWRDGGSGSSAVQCAVASAMWNAHTSTHSTTTTHTSICKLQTALPLQGLHARGLAGGVGDAAQVLAVGETDVAALAPRRAPRVLDLPVRGAQRARAVAHHRDAVVELRAAAEEGVEDARLVGLELGGVDGHGERCRARPHRPWARPCGP